MTPDELLKWGTEQVQAEVNTLRDQAMNDLIKQAFKRYYREVIQSGDVSKLPFKLQLAVKEVGVETFVSSTKGRKKDTSDWFITISAKDPVDPVKFFEQMSKCVKKAQLRGKGSYVLEQRSEADQEPYGYHIHWMVHFDTQSSKSVIVQQVYQCFTKYLAGKNYVDAIPCYTPEEIAAREKYIRGEKKLDKMAKVEKDVLVREKLKIPRVVEHCG